MFYPRYMFHNTGGEKLISTQEELESLNAEWADSPEAAREAYRALNDAPQTPADTKSEEALAAEAEAAEKLRQELSKTPAEPPAEIEAIKAELAKDREAAGAAELDRILAAHQQSQANEDALKDSVPASAEPEAAV